MRILGGHAVGAEVIIYQTGFESSEGFVATQTYNNQTAKLTGSEGQQWSVLMGTATATDAISGSQSLQMRAYKDNSTIPCAQTTFSLNKVTSFTFKAKRHSKNGTIKVQHSLDGGSTWSAGVTYSMTTAVKNCGYKISDVGVDNVRFKITYTTTPTATMGVAIDDFIVYGIDESAVAEPIISPVSGTLFDDSQEITIVSDEGTSIWYTLDNTVPNAGAPSLEYTLPFTINKTTTVKAIAVNAGGTASEVAEATYTKKEWLSGLSALVAKIKADNSTSAKEYYVNLTGAVVTGVLGTYSAYLEEGTTGIFLNKSSHGLTLAQKYSGKATVSAKMNDGIPQLTAFDCATVAEGAELPLITITLAELTADFDTYLSRRVKIADAVTTTELTTKTTGEIVQGDERINVYPNTTITTAIAENHKVDVVGWPTVYNSEQQLNVWAEGDITDKGAAPVLYFETDAVSVRVDGDVPEPSLTNTYDEEPVYSSSVETVATVNASTGEVSIVGEGTTIITATLSTANKKASYTLTVTGLPVKQYGYYYQVTSADDLVAGGRYLIVSKDGTGGASKAMGAQNSSYRSSVATKIVDEDGFSVIKGLPNGAYEVVLGIGSETNTWSFYDERSSVYLSLNSSKNALQSETTLSKNGSATIAIDGVGNADIVFQSFTTRHLRYNASDPRFACYTSAQVAIQLYKLHTADQGEFSIGADGFASFYTDDAFVMPEGVQGGIVTEAVDNKLTINYNYASGATVPAGTALLLKGAAHKYAYDITTSEETAPTGNLLHGADAVDEDGNTFVAGTDVKYYVLSKKGGKNLGFYWRVADGAAFPYQAGKAFLAVDNASGVREFFRFDDIETGIDNVENTPVENGRIYTLTGVYVGNDMRALPKGIYVVNGKKVAY